MPSTNITVLGDYEVNSQNVGDDAPNSKTRTIGQTKSPLDSLPAFVIGFATLIILCVLYGFFKQFRHRCHRAPGGGSPDLSLVAANSKHRQSTVAASRTFGDVDGLCVTESITGSDRKGNGRSPSCDTCRPNLREGSSKSPFRFVGQPFGRQGQEGGQESPQNFHRDAQESDYPTLCFQPMSLSDISTMTASVASEVPTPNERTADLSESSCPSRRTQSQSLDNLSQISVMSTVSRSKMSTKGHPSVACRKESRMEGSSPRRSSPLNWEESATTAVKSSLEILRQLPLSPFLVTDYSYDDDVNAVCASNNCYNYDRSHDESLSEEEDESGWTSSAGKSESSSDISMGTYLKSLCSATSPASPRSQDSVCSDLWGEGCLTPEFPTASEACESPENAKQCGVMRGPIESREERSGEGSLDLSLEESVSTECRAQFSGDDNYDLKGTISSLDKTMYDIERPWPQVIDNLEENYVVPAKPVLHSNIPCSNVGNSSSSLRSYKGSSNEAETGGTSHSMHRTESSITTLVERKSMTIQTIDTLEGDF